MFEGDWAFAVGLAGVGAFVMYEQIRRQDLVRRFLRARCTASMSVLQCRQTYGGRKARRAKRRLDQATRFVRAACRVRRPVGWHWKGAAAILSSIRPDERMFLRGLIMRELRIIDWRRVLHAWSRTLAHSEWGVAA